MEYSLGWRVRGRNCGETSAVPSREGEGRSYSEAHQLVGEKIPIGKKSLQYFIELLSKLRMGQKY